MKRTYLSLIFVLMAMVAAAVPATPLPIDITLADGETIQVYLLGDEYSSYYTLLDGTPVRIENGVMVEDYTLPERALQKRRIARAADATQASFPTEGTPRSVVILVNFKDLTFVKTNEDFKNLLNQSGYSENGAIGSVRDYFIASSDSMFQPQFDVYGPYDLPNDMAYYGAPTNDSHDVRAADMIAHACSAADEDGVDFSQYDTDGDGVIDNVFVYYAGNNEAEGANENTIWPHRSAVYPPVRYDGVLLYGYACTSELRYTRDENGDIVSTMCGIGTFCHEFSHVLGLMDLYDTDGRKQTVGSWDVMSSGNYNGDGCMPPSYTAFERFSLGWLTPELLTEPRQYMLEPLETANKAYMISATGNKVEPNVNAEYFLLENRQYVGWDANYRTMPGSGMLVWHVSYNKTVWAQNRPNSGNNLMCYIECASGAKQTNGSAADPFPGTKKKTTFMPTLNDGTNLNKPLLEIQQLGTDIVFTFIREGNRHLAFATDDMVTLNSNITQLPDTIIRYMPAQKITLMGSSLAPDRAVELKTSKNNFQLSLDSVSGWAAKVSVFSSADSTLNVPIYVRYRPSMQMCDYDEGNIQAQQGATMAVLSVRGTAPRATLITEPIALAPTNISPYSAELNWTAVYDASHYYATIYQLKDGETSFVEGFENFGSASDVVLAGWYTNFNTLSSTVKASGKYSLWAKETGNQIVSPMYEQPISTLSFWYSVPTTDAESVGSILIEGFDGKQWTTIETLAIERRDHKKTYKKDWSDANELSYVQFRLSFTISEQSNGVCIDSFTATCDKYVEYLYKGEELTLSAITGEETVTLYLNDLEPDVEYCYKIRASDKGRKGCEEHVVEMSQVQTFRTLAGKNAETDLSYGIDSLYYNQVERVIYVPEAEGDRTLYFYDVLGHLIGQVAVPAQQNTVAFPEGSFIRGNIYIVKYAVTESVKRKDRRIKIVY